jgi:alpha-tubulin suppressor-like RCC1 family protein
MDTIKLIEAGSHHSMILTDHGLIYAFGFGAHGQLGMGYVKNL